MGISTCRLIVLPSILYHASLNSRACFVCARPNSSVSVQLKVWQLSYVCAAGSEFIIVSFDGVFVFSYSCFNFLRTRKCPTNNNDTMTNTNFQITLPSTSATQQSKHSNDAIPSSGIHSTMTTHSSTSNEIRSTAEQPIRRSRRIQERSNIAKL